MNRALSLKKVFISDRSVRFAYRKKIKYENKFLEQRPEGQLYFFGSPPEIQRVFSSMIQFFVFSFVLADLPLHSRNQKGPELMSPSGHIFYSIFMQFFLGNWPK